MKYFLIIFVFIYLLGSCKNEPSKFLLKTSFDTLVFETKIPLDISGDYYSFINNNTVFRYRSSKQTITKISLLENRVNNIDLIDLDLGAFYKVHSRYMANEFERNIFYKLESNYKILKKYIFENQLRTDSGNFVTMNFQYQPFIYFNNKVITNIVADVDIFGYYEFPTLGVFDLKTKEVTKFARFPEFFNDDTSWYDFYPSYCFNKSKELISVVFHPDQNIYNYNLEGELVSINKIEIDCLKDIQPPIQERLMDFRYIDVYSISQPKIAGLIYDEFRKMYYLIILREHDIESDNIVEYHEKAFDIYIYDSNLSKIKELNFEESKYNNKEIFVGEEGLFVNMLTTNNSLKYLLIRFEI